MTLPQVVELCGLPGSGKSAVADSLVRVLTDRGTLVVPGTERVGPAVPARRRLVRKARLVTAESLAHPRAVRRAVHAAAGRRGGVTGSERESHDTVGRSVQWLVTQRLLHAARRTRTLHVFDEGLLQALWSIGLRGDVGGVLDMLSEDDRWERPGVVLVVDASVDVCAHRLRVRETSHSRTQALPEPERRRELLRGQGLLEELVAWWVASAGDQRVIRVHNDDLLPPPVGLAEQVTRLLSTDAHEDAAGRG